jgi:hypothetical protein
VVVNTFTGCRNEANKAWSTKVQWWRRVGAGRTPAFLPRMVDRMAQRWNACRLTLQEAARLALRTTTNQHLLWQAAGQALEPLA